MIRALNMEYFHFELGTELKSHHKSKFDFWFGFPLQDKGGGRHTVHKSASKTQTGYITKSTKITAHQLISEHDASNNKGDFSIFKYFSSYLVDENKKETKYYILFTNLGFHSKVLRDRTEDRDIKLIELKQVDVGKRGNIFS